MLFTLNSSFTSFCSALFLLFGPAVVVDRLTASDILLVAHQVQAERCGVQELAVYIQAAAGLVGAIGEAAVEEVTRLGGLAHHVQAAASRATTTTKVEFGLC